MMLGFVRGAIHRSLFDLISVCREAAGRGRLRPSLASNALSPVSTLTACSIMALMEPLPRGRQSGFVILA